MKHYATRSCGHESEEQLFGPDKERKSKIEWLKSTPCKDCWKARRKEIANEKGLPQLSGSEKQIDWAFTIREEFENNISEKLEALAEQNNPAQAERLAAIRSGLASMLQANSAKFWIDNRSDLQEILKKRIEGGK